MLPTITLDRTESLDSWCTTYSRTPSRESLPSPEGFLSGPSATTHQGLPPSSSNELLDSFFDAQEALPPALAHDGDASSHSLSSSTIVSPASSPSRSLRPRKLEPARPRRLSSLRSQETPPSVRVFVDPIYARAYAPSSLLGSRSPRTSSTISPRHSTELLEPLGHTAISPEPPQDTSDTATGLWGSDWNDLARWSPYSLVQERIDERSSLEDDRRSCRHGFPSPALTYNDALERPQFPTEEDWFSQRPLYDCQTQTEMQPSRGLRSMLRHTRSAMHLGVQRGSTERPEASLSQASVSHSHHGNRHATNTKRRKFDSSTGRAFGKWLKKVLGDTQARPVDAVKGGKNHPSLSPSTSLAAQERTVSARPIPEAVEGNGAADDPENSDGKAFVRQHCSGTDGQQRSTNWSRRPSLTSIYPRSILASPAIGASNVASASRSSCHLSPPFPPSPVTSRHVSFEDHQNGRPSLSLSEAANRCSFSGNARGRRSSSSARSNANAELCHMNSTPNFWAPSLRARCQSERSSNSYDGGGRSIASLNSIRTSFTGPRTPTSVDGSFLSASQIFEQGPKATSRGSIEMTDINLHDRAERPMSSIRVSMRGAVEKATRSWSSLSYHAENLECEDHRGLPVVAVRRRKSSIWQHSPTARMRTLSINATKGRARSPQSSAAI